MHAKLDKNKPGQALFLIFAVVLLSLPGVFRDVCSGADPPLTVSKAGAGTGTVNSLDGRIDCGPTCGSTYPPGTVVTLTAAPASGSYFGGWSGAGCSGFGTCTVTMNAAKNVTATFNPVFLGSGLVGYWRFDNQENLGADSSGVGNNGVASNTNDITYTSSGRVNGAVRFVEGAANRSIVVANNSSLNFTTGITMAAWVMLDGDNSDNGNTIISKCNGEGEVYALLASINTFSSHLFAQFRGDAIDGGYTVPVNVWTYVAVTLDTAAPTPTITFYANGGPVLSLAYWGGLGTNSADLYIGASPCGGKEDFSGLMDEVRLYNRSLSAAEVATLYNADNISVNPAHGATGAAVDAPVTAVFSEAMDASTINTGTMTLSTFPSAAIFQNLLFYNGHTYGITRGPMSWADASTMAQQAGGYLVTINDAAENQFLSENYPGTGSSQRPWIGLNDVQNNGIWVWSNGDPSAYREWAPGEPSSGEHCVETNWLVPGQWNNAPCPERKPAVVEWDLVAASVAYDTPTQTATLTPSTSLDDGTTYTAAVRSGADGVRDSSGNALDSGFVWNFTTDASCVAPSSDLISWWKGEGNANDRMELNNGVLKGNVWFTPGKTGRAFHLSGNTFSYISLPNNDSLKPTTAITLEAWINPANIYTDQHIFSTAGGAGPSPYGHDYYLRIENTDVEFSINCYPLRAYGVISMANRWYHVAATYDQAAGERRIYVDGLLVASENGDTYNQPINTGHTNVTIGLNARTAANIDTYWASFNGHIDEARIYRRALTQSEIRSIYLADGSGLCTGPSVSVSPASPFNFNDVFRNVIVETSVTQTFTISNDGNQSLIISNIAWTGDPDYTLDVAGGSSPCGPSVTLPEGASCTVNLTFHPTSAALKTGTLTVSSNDPSSRGTIAVTGTGSGTGVQSSCAPPSSGLVSWWRGEGNALDQMERHGGTLINGAAFASGVVGQAFNFNGTNQNVDSGPWTPGSQWTIMAWVNPSWVPSDRRSILGSMTECLDWAIVMHGGQFGVAIRPPSSCSMTLGSNVFPTPGTWYHVVGVSDGQTAKIYVNGELKSSTDVSYYVGSDCNVGIGACVGNGQNFPGLIDEPAVYNRPLSSAEIQAVYSAGTAGQCAGHIVAVSPSPYNFNSAFRNLAIGSAVTQTFTISNDGTQSLLLTGIALTPDTDADFSVTGGTCGSALGIGETCTVDVTFVPSSEGTKSGTLMVSSSDPDPSRGTVPISGTVSPCVPPPSGLVAWWRGDNSAEDETDQHNGLWAGGEAYAGGLVGQAFSLDGGGGHYVQVASNPNLDPTVAATLEAWVYFDELPSAAGRWMHIAGKPGSLTDFDLVAPTDNRIYFFVANGRVVASSTVVQTGRWYHVAATYRANDRLEIFINGELEETEIIPDVTRSTNSTDFGIGGAPNNYWRAFHGRIDEVRLFNRALSAWEILAIHNAGGRGVCAATGTIHGSVTESGSGLPLSGATVSCSTWSETTTDSNGDYVLSNVPPGHPFVTASRYGYADQTQDIDLGALQNVPLSFSLVKNSGSMPSVTTGTVASITTTTATGSGEVTSEGGDSVTARGVCWSTAPSPVVGSACTNDGTGAGAFTSSITGLMPDTLYHVRAYATNSAGTAYGDDVAFLTPYAGNLPGAPTNVTATAGHHQATVSFSPPASNGGSPIISYTVTSHPGNLSQSGSSSPITVPGLEAATYTFTVTATNAIGTGPASGPSNSVTVYNTLTTQVTPSGAGTISLLPSGGMYGGGASVSLTAVPNSGYRFQSWTGDLTGSANPASLTMDGDKSVTGVFVDLPARTLLVTKDGTGSGTVRSLTAGTHQTAIDCGGTCSEDYYEGSVVTLRAAPDAGSVFAGWSGDACTGSVSLTCMVSLNAAKTVTATFSATQSTAGIWARTYAGVYNDDSISAVQQTADSGYIVAGTTIVNEDYYYGVWVLKLDGGGNVQWRKTYGGEYGDDYGRSVKQTADGGYIVAGYTYSFGAGSFDAWVLKLDGSGNVEWEKTYGGARSDIVNSIQQTADGGYIASGHTYNSDSTSYPDAWVLKLDAGGEVQWERSYGGTNSYESSNSVQQTADGGYIILALTRYPYNYDGWLLKLDAGGEVQWQKKYGGQNLADYLDSIQQTADGGYIVAGSTSNFGAGLGDAWVLKLDGSGNVSWQKTYGGPDYDSVTSIQQTTDGGYIVAGNTYSFSSNGAGWLLKLDGSGNVDWQNIYGNNGAGITAIQQTADGGYVAVGYNAGYLPWVLKLDANGDMDGCPADLIGTSSAVIMDTGVTGADTGATIGEPSIVFEATAASVASPAVTLGTVCGSCAAEPSGLVSWWKGENNANDQTALNPGTPNGVAYTTGKVGQAFYFDGVSSSIVVPDSPSLDLTSNWTLQAWIYPTGPGGLGNGGGILSKIGGSGGNNGYQFCFTNNGTLDCIFNAAGEGWPANRVIGGVINFNAWSHVACTYDNDTLRVYVNGALAGSTYVGPKSVVNSSSQLRINGDDNGNVFFPGMIDEPAIYNRALTELELQAIYNAGGRGVCTELDIAVSPASPFYFGNIDVGNSAEQLFTVSNTGLAELTITGIALSADVNFTLDLNAGTSPCGASYPKALATGEACTVNVTFHPLTGGEKNGTLTVNSNDPDTPSIDIALFGTGAAPPTVTTAAVSGIHARSATGGGNVISNGGDWDLFSGICWSTAPDPTTSDMCTIEYRDVVGPFTSAITDLTPNTTYHVRAVAINSVGTAYGADVEFKTLIAYTLTTQVSGSGTGVVGLNPSGGSYDEGSSVQLTAGPVWGSRFDHWEGNLSGSANPVTITMDADKTVTAVFVDITSQYTLTVEKAGVGTGTVTSTPSGIDCGGTCSNSYWERSLVTLRATPDNGFHFSGWSGGCTGEALTCMVTMDAAKTVTANFTLTAPAATTWAKTYTASDDDWISAIQQTADGGYVVAGRSTSDHDAWVLKLDGSGNVDWQKTYGGANGDIANAVQQTADGGYVLAGRTYSFGLGSGAWILKLDGRGNVEWEKSYAGGYNQEAFAVQQTADGGYIALGETYSAGLNQDAWLLKLDAAGNVQWQKTYGGSGYDVGRSVQQTADGGYIVAAYTYSFGGGDGDAWVLKLDGSGNVEWEKTYGDANGDYLPSIQQTMDGGYIIAGSNSSVDDDAWVLKLDGSGNVDWQKRYGGAHYDYARAIQQTTDGGYIVAGNTYSFSSYGAGWVFKLDGSGNVEWEKTYGSNGEEFYAVQQTADGGYIAIGHTDAYGPGDLPWVLKLDANGNMDGCPADLIGTSTAMVTDTGVTGAETSAIVEDPFIVSEDTTGTVASQALTQEMVCGPPPSVITASVTGITSTTATGGGAVTSEGGASVTARGVCWNTSGNPTTSDTCTTDGSGMGAYTSSITGLSLNTLYHVRAYATNSIGTAYGNDIPFTTLAQHAITGSVTGGHGSINCTSPVDYGGSSTCTIVPDAGYHLATLTDNGADVFSLVSGNSYVINNVTADHTVAGTFAVDTFVITASSGTKGSISPSGSVTLNFGASQTFTMTPNSGAVVYDVIVDGVSQGARASFTFSNVTANHTISAAFISEAGLVAWYPFDGNALDYSGNLNNGTVNGATLTADRFGNPNSAYNFNGTGNWIQVATHNNIPSGSSPYTVSMWASVTDYAVDQGSGWNCDLLSRGVAANLKYQALALKPNGHLYLSHGNLDYDTGYVVEQNVWHHLAAVYDGTVERLYIDGALFWTSTSVTLNVDNTPGTAIGRYVGSANWYYNGKLDDVRIYNAALPISDIRLIAGVNDYDGDGIPDYQEPLLDSFTATPFVGNAPLTVSFTCTAHDLDGSIASYQWDYGDGNTFITSNPTSSHTYLDRGSFNATCTVVDNDGHTALSSAVRISISPLAFSTFDTDTEGWSLTADGTYPQWVATGGNPGGNFAGVDGQSGGTWFFNAPNQFLGDKTLAYKGILSFDLKQYTTANQYNWWDVVLVGNGVTLVYDMPSNPLTTWTHYEVALDETVGWKDYSTNLPPTRAQFLGVLSRLANVQIRGEFVSGYDYCYLDNVILNTGRSAPWVSFSGSPSRTGPAPLTLTLSCSAQDYDGTVTAYVLDYHDGSAPLNFSSPVSVNHTFTTPGVYFPTCTATDDSGIQVSVPLHIAASVLVESTFDNGTCVGTACLDGWTTSGDGTTPVFSLLDGNPGGYLSASDSQSGTSWYWTPPAKFLGDQSLAYGGTLSFDIKTNYREQAGLTNDLFLTGNGLTLRLDMPSNAPLTWQSQPTRVTLNESAGWVKNADGTVPSRAEFQSVLANLTQILILGEFSTNADTGSIDNIVLTANASPPTVTTASITGITSTTAAGGGDVTSEGGTTVTARGVCWNTTGSPTTSDPCTTDGSGSGAFTSSIAGLTPGIPYYVRAYAVNSAGTAYGNEVSFSTLNRYNLTTSISPAGYGWITLNPTGGVYDQGTSVQVSAGPLVPGFYCFEHWGGDLSGSDNPATVSMNADKNVTAFFVDGVGPNISISPVGGGSIGFSPARCNSSGTLLTITVVPAAGYRFDHWQADVPGINGSTATTVSFTVTGGEDITAVFERVYTISGTVTDGSSPIVGVTVNLTGAATDLKVTGTDGTFSFTDKPNGSYTITPSMPPQYAFSPPSRSIMVTGADVSDQDFTGTLQYFLTADVSPLGAGTIELNPAGGVYNAGTSVQLRAIAGSGYRFSSWTGDLAGSTNPINLTMNGNKAVTAVFLLEQRATIAAGSSHSVASRLDGTVWTWGNNSHGQLGDNTITDRPLRVQVVDPSDPSGYLKNVAAVATGAVHTVALKSDGTVWAWGSNSAGQLGDNTITDHHFPAQVVDFDDPSGYLTGVMAIAAGGGHTAALKSDGSLWTWGDNSYGQLGDSTFTSRHYPVLALDGVTAIAAGEAHSLALKSDGSVWAWGRNSEGQLGDENLYPSSSSVAVQVVDSTGAPNYLSGVAAIGAGMSYSSAVKSDGTVWSWGENADGQLGDDSTTRRLLPVQVYDFSGPPTPLTGVAAVDGGVGHTVALKSNGTVWTWGSNSDGQLGDDTTTQRLLPVQVVHSTGFLTNVTAVAAGYNFALALKADGSVWAWGANGSGELGDGSNLDRQVPVEVNGLKLGPTAVELRYFKATGSDYSIALEWETGAELDNAGFRLWRARAGKEKYSRIMEALIPAEGSPTKGAHYAIEDLEVLPGPCYRYKLEDIDNFGLSTFHGPTSAAVGAIKLISPTSGSSVPRETRPVFAWESSPCDRFRLELADSADFGGKLVTLEGPKMVGKARWIRDSRYSPTASEWKRIRHMLGKSKTLYWRVNGKDRHGCGFTSEAHVLNLTK